MRLSKNDWSWFTLIWLNICLALATGGLVIIWPIFSSLSNLTLDILRLLYGFFYFLVFFAVVVIDIDVCRKGIKWLQGEIP